MDRKTLQGALANAVIAAAIVGAVSSVALPDGQTSGASAHPVADTRIGIVSGSSSH